jgi:hypothetical protein
MPTAELAVSKDATNLVDVTCVGGKEPLHRDFGRGVQIAGLGSEACGLDRHVLEGRIGRARRRQRRRLDFEQTSIRAEPADLGQQLGTQP